MLSPRQQRHWTEAGRIAARMDRDAAKPAEIRKLATQLRALVLEAQKPDAEPASVRRNPLVTFFNPPKIFARNVLAMIYQHDADGQLYAHGFGAHDVGVRQRGGDLILTDLPSRTNVLAEALPNGAVLVRHNDGRAIWKEFEV